MLVTVALELRMVIVMSAIRIGVIRMKNKEKYAKEIVEIICNGKNIAVDKKTERPVVCSNFDCDKCMFRAENNCRRMYLLKEWAESEFLEKPVISKRNIAFLDYIKGEYKCISRDEDGRLFVWKCEPSKSVSEGEWADLFGNFEFSSLSYFAVDFPMVKWSDDKPWLIEGLKKLEVVEEYE